MKVIFLDVDGVLNSQQLFEKCEDDQLISVDEDNIKNLKNNRRCNRSKDRIIIILEIRMGRTQ